MMNDDGKLAKWNTSFPILTYECFFSGNVDLDTYEEDQFDEDEA